MAKPNQSKRVTDGALGIEIRKDTFNEQDRTVEVIFSTGAAVKRYSWDEGYYMEELSMDPKHIRLDRLNKGASFLDTHEQWSMASRLGAVVPGTARIENGLGIAQIQITRNPEGERLMIDLRDGMPLNISVGYKTHAYERQEGEDEGKLPTYRAIDWEPMEISAVPVPADPGSQARSAEKDTGAYDVPVFNRDGSPAAKAASRTDEDPNMTKEEIAAKAAEDKRLADLEAARNEGRELARKEVEAAEAKRVADEAEAKRLAALNAAPVDPVVVAQEAARAAVAAERTRSDSITSFGAQHRIPEAVVRKAVSEGKSMEEFRSMAFDALIAAQEKNPTFSVAPQLRNDDNDERLKRREAVAGAILHRAMPGKHKLEDASKEYAHMRLMDLAKDIMQADGVAVRGMSPNELASRAFHTTSDFPAILDQVVNKLVRESYRAAPQLWRPLGTQTTAPDFRGMQSMVVGELGELQKVNEHGEYKRSTFTTGGQVWNIATYGLIFGVTRQALINDHIGLFAAIPKKFNNSVLRTESNIVWDIFLTNPKMADGKALFHADHGNLAATGTALSIASITAARLAMSKQKDFEGKDPFPVVPKYLVVPPELEYLATQILFGTFSPAVLGETVPDYVRSLKLIVEPKLSVASNAAVPWFLVAEPGETDTFEYAYLEGENGPYTESRQGFDIDGTEYKVRLDFGAAAQDARGFYKNPGVVLS